MNYLKNGDAILDDHDDIAQHVLNYFSSLYDVPNECHAINLISFVVPASVTLEDNNALTRLPFFMRTKV